MSFDIQRHPEEFEGTYLAEQEFLATMDRLDNAFTSGVKQLVGYRRVASASEYHAAVYEAYEQADEEMKDFLVMLGINSVSEFKVYINGVVKGMSINE